MEYDLRERGFGGDKFVIKFVLILILMEYDLRVREVTRWAGHKQS